MKVRTKKNIHDHILDEYDHQHLEPDKIYEVIGITYENYRVIDEIGEPILYPKYLFEVTDPLIPADWIWEKYASDEYYIDPPELSERGFYEDFFDRQPYAGEIFRQFVISHELMTEDEWRKRYEDLK